LPSGVDGGKPRDEFDDIHHDLVICNGGPDCPYYQAQLMQAPQARGSPNRKFDQHSHSLMQETPASNQDDQDEENTYSGLMIVGHHISLP
jgi:hypothetical protein